MNTRFLRTVLAQRPGLGASGGFFFFQPVGDILRGFAIAKLRGFARIHEFALPLYDRLDFLHITFADQLPIDAEFLCRETPVAAARTFLQVIGQFEAKARSKADPETFLNLVHSRAGKPWGQRAVVTTLAFHGALDAASRALSPLGASMAFVEHVPHWVSELRDLREALDAGNKPATDLLNRWQAGTRERLQIPARQH